MSILLISFAAPLLAGAVVVGGFWIVRRSAQDLAA